MMLIPILLLATLQAAQKPTPMQDEPLSVPPISYPAEAKAARIQGAVQLQINVDETGHVTEVHALAGPEALRQAAIDAYSRATYRPILRNGKAIPAIISTTVNFTLSERPNPDVLLDAKFRPLQAECERLANEKTTDALASCREAVRVAGGFSAGFDLEARATALNDLVQLLLIGGKQSGNLPEASIFAGQAIDLVAPYAHDVQYLPAVAIASITRCEVRSLEGNLRGAATDCSQAEAALTTLLGTKTAQLDAQSALNVRAQLRQVLQLHALVAERDHHASEAKALQARADSL